MTGARTYERSRNRQREADVLEALRRLGPSESERVAETAGYRHADVVRSLHALAVDGVVVPRPTLAGFLWATKEAA